LLSYQRPANLPTWVCLGVNVHISATRPDNPQNGVGRRDRNVGSLRCSPCETNAGWGGREVYPHISRYRICRAAMDMPRDDAVDWRMDDDLPCHEGVRRAVIGKSARRGERVREAAARTQVG